MTEWLITRAIQNGTLLFPTLAAAFAVAAVALVRRRRGLLRWAGGLGCAALIAASAAGFVVSRKLTGTVARRAQQFSFRLVADGSQRTLADYRGRVVLLNFWATWCPHCVKEMPDLESIAKRYAGEGVSVVTVSDEEPAKLRPAAGSARVSAFISGDIEPVGALEQLACQARPTTVVIDRDGHIRDVLVGEHSYASFESALRRVL